MQVISGGRFAWIYTLLLSSLHLWRLCLSAAKQCPSLPGPTLHIRWTSAESAALVCRSPEGHQGLVFMLYRVTEKVDSQRLQSSASEVQFSVSRDEGDSGVEQLFCCLYQSQDGCFSAFSPYTKLEHRGAVGPSPAAPAFPPPLLSVHPPPGTAKRGDVLSFTCSVPPTPHRPQSQSGFGKAPTFLLLRTSERTGPTSVLHQPRANRAASAEPRPGVFTVGPVTGGEQGDYTCIYQITTNRKLVNSTVSNTVQVTISDVLPPPSFVLQRQTDVWCLLCTGSPSYPGAVFYVYPVDGESPAATQQARALEHQACIPLPVQDKPVASYQCQYSYFLLGSNWSRSERSPTLAVTKETFSAPTPAESAVDWPLVLGSLSAAVLFLCSVVLVAVGAHRRVRAAAEKKKKKRQEAQFWSQFHGRDHVVELPSRVSSFSSEDWACGANETNPAASSWNSLSTFTTPIHLR